MTTAFDFTQLLRLPLVLAEARRGSDVYMRRTQQVSRARRQRRPTPVAALVKGCLSDLLPLSLGLVTCALAVAASLGKPAFANALQVRGAAQVVGELQTSAPPFNQVYQSWRTPLWLGLDAHASDRLSLHVLVDWGFAAFPEPVSPLGNSGVHAPDHWTQDAGWAPSSQTLRLSQAYLSYRSPFGEITAGRIPRNWGWGIWRNAQVSLDTRVLSTTDAVGLTADVTPSFSGSFYYEKASEGNSFSRADDADGFTVEAVLADDPTEASPQGISREVGFSYHQFRNRLTQTELNVIDGYWKVFTAKSLFGGEILFPSGKTRNPSYAWLGGMGPCSQGNERSLTCESQKIEGFALYLKAQLLLNNLDSVAGNSATLAGLEASRERLPTSKRPISHVMTFSGAYTGGDADAFRNMSSRNDTLLSTVPLHPNFHPSLLMFSSVRPAVSALPSGALRNVVFVSGTYTYESPGLGALAPSMIWAGLSSKNEEALSASAYPGLGQSKNLGVEVDFSYSYKTNDNVTWHVDSGCWLPGTAWESNGYQKSGPVFGLRAGLSTQF